MLVRSFFTVSALTMLSRLFGFVRDILMAAFLGAGPIADAFFVAFRLPNFFRSLFAEGAFSAAFVPIFSRILTQKGRPEALLFAEQALSILMAVLVIFVVLAEAFMPTVMSLVAPGFVSDPEKFALVVEFGRITFPFLFFISMVALMGGVLNSVNHFAFFAASPILLNIVLILSLTVLRPYAANTGEALSIGVFSAGLFQIMWMIAGGRRANIRLKIRKPVLTPEVRRLGKLVLPVAVGAGVFQLNLLIGVVVASFLPEGSVSYLYYADRIAQLPLGVIGVAIGTALLPLLSRQLRSGERKAADYSQNRSIEISLLLTVPATVAMLVIPDTILSVLFERGVFDHTTTLAAAAALMAFGVGVPAYVLVRVLSPGFFAREDTKTPVKIAVFAVVLNFVLNLILMGPLQHVGIALATAIAAWVNAGLSGMVLLRRGHLVFDNRLKKAIPKIILSALLMGGALFALKGFLFIGALSTLQQILRLGLLVGVGGSLYFSLVVITGALDLNYVKKLLRGKV